MEDISQKVAKTAEQLAVKVAHTTKLANELGGISSRTGCASLLAASRTGCKLICFTQLGKLCRDASVCSPCIRAGEIS